MCSRHCEIPILTMLDHLEAFLGAHATTGGHYVAKNQLLETRKVKHPKYTNFCFLEKIKECFYFSFHFILYEAQWVCNRTFKH